MSPLCHFASLSSTPSFFAAECLSIEGCRRHAGLQADNIADAAIFRFIVIR